MGNAMVWILVVATWHLIDALYTNIGRQGRGLDGQGYGLTGYLSSIGSTASPGPGLSPGLLPRGVPLCRVLRFPVGQHTWVSTVASCHDFESSEVGQTDIATYEWERVSWWAGKRFLAFVPGVYQSRQNLVAGIKGFSRCMCMQAGVGIWTMRS